MGKIVQWNRIAQQEPTKLNVNKLAKALSIFYGDEHKFEHIRTEGRFSRDTTDEEWIGALCRDPEPWAIISGDVRMLNRPNIIADLQNSNNIFLCMDDNWCTRNNYHSQTWKLFKVWPEIVAYSCQRGPRFYEIRTISIPKVEELRFSKRLSRRKPNLR